MARKLSQTFVTGSAAAGGSVTFDVGITGGPSIVNILKVKVLPSTIGDGNTTSVELFHKATRLTADRYYDAQSFPGNLYEPMDNSSGSPAETAYGAPIAADDEDGTGQWHGKISNAGLVSKTYTVTIEYEEIQQTATSGTVTFRSGANFAGNVLPASDNASALGSAAARWTSGNFSTSVNIGLLSDAAGSLYIGANAAVFAYLDVAGTSSPFLVGRLSRGTHGTGNRTNVVSGDAALAIRAEMWSGATGFWPTGQIAIAADGTVVDNQRPGARVDFYTNAVNGAQTLNASLRGNGQFQFQPGSNGSPSLASLSDLTSGIWWNGATINFTSAGTQAFQITATGVGMPTTSTINWNADTTIVRDGVGIVALKNGTSNQELRVYGTTTGPKYVRLFHDNTNGFLWETAGGLYAGTTVDDVFGVYTNGATRWVSGISTNSYSWYPNADNTYDVGLITNRVRSVKVGTSVNIGVNANVATAGALRLEDSGQIAFGATQAGTETMTTKALTNNTVTDLCEIQLNTTPSGGGMLVHYTITVTTATPGQVQTETGTVFFTGATDQSSVTTADFKLSDSKQMLGSGTLTTSFSVTTSTSFAKLRVNANTSLGSPAVRIYYHVTNLSGAPLTIL